MEHSSAAVRTACDKQVDGGGGGAVRPKMTCKKLTENDCREWKPRIVVPGVRST